MCFFTNYLLSIPLSEHNAFEGDIPFEYLVDLSTITRINLSNNEFSGIVHDNLSEKWGMEQLQELNLANNKLEGEVGSHTFGDKKSSRGY